MTSPHACCDQVYNDAEECYAALADFLGDKHFFFGDRYLRDDRCER